MSTTTEQIEAIEEEIRETPLHKATEHHIGKLRARLSRLKDRQIQLADKKKGGGGGYAVRKQGDATIVLVGPPSAGKSTLLNCLTNAKSKVAPYAFTTLTVIPGMMTYHDAQIQILDVPGLIAEAQKGRGRGREVLSVARGADLIILLVDVEKANTLEGIAKSLHQNGIRLDQDPPAVDVEKKLSGGITVHTNLKHEISKEAIKQVAAEMGVKNADITIKEKMSLDRFIDALSTNRAYIPSLKVINKIDLDENFQKADCLAISAQEEVGIDNLKEKIWEKLNLIRIYLVRKDEKPSRENPLIVRRESLLADVAEKIGEEFAQEKTKAVIWGPGAKFPGQEVSLTTKVQEGMQVRFI